MALQILAAIVLGLILIGFNRLHWSKASYAQTQVRDGDSILISGPKQSAECRINGYDAPEWNQTHGAAATRALKALLKDGYRWKAIDVDPYGRLVIEVRNAKGSVARQMIAGGYGHSAGRYGVHQLTAKILGRGLWANRNTVHPATFRALTSKGKR